MRLRLLLTAVFCLHAAYSQPQRIVSTSPSITETLFALDLGPRVVGVSNFCRYPAEVVKLPKVGTFLRPDAELIARLNPDLVIIQKMPNDLATRLAGLGIRYLEVDQGSMPTLYSNIEAVGKAAGVHARALKLISEIQDRLNRIQAQASAATKPKVLFIVGRRLGTLSDLVAVGTDSYLNDLIRMAGGLNVLAQPSLPAYPQISLETVIRLNPDIIIDTADPMEGARESGEKRKANEALWGQQGELMAVRKRQVHALSSEAFVVPGPRVVEVVERLFAIFHGGGEH